MATTKKDEWKRKDDIRAIYTGKNKTRTFRINGTFIRRGLAKTRLILEQPLTPVLR